MVNLPMSIMTEHVVEESHGLIQLVFEQPCPTGPTEAGTWSALDTRPGWFFDAEELAREAGAIKNDRYLDPLDCTVVKFQLDALYLEGRYEEALTLAKSCNIHLETVARSPSSLQRRELMDVLAVLAIKCGDRAWQEVCWRWFREAGRRISDTGMLWTRMRVGKALGYEEDVQEAARIYLKLRPGETEVVRLFLS